jgi:hypothetical protein
MGGEYRKKRVKHDVKVGGSDKNEKGEGKQKVGMVSNVFCAFY